MIQQIEAAGGKSELLRQLTFVENPTKRLQELLKHGLVEEAREALTAMLDMRPIYFQDPSRCEHVPHLGAPRKSKGEKKERRAKRRGFKVCVGHATEGRTDYPMFTFDPDGLRRAMQWSAEEADAFMVVVFRRAISVDPRNLRTEIASWAGPWETGATERAMEQCLPKEHPLRKEVERWCLRSWFFCEGFSNHFNEKGLKHLLGVSIPDRRHHHNENKYLVMPADYERECAIAEALTERLRALGMSDDEIREDFFVWLEHYVGHLNPNLILGIANARIIAWPEEVRDRRNAIMASVWDHMTMEWLFNGHNLYHPYVVAKLMDAGACDTAAGEEKAQALFRTHAARKLAEGNIGTVASVLASLGHRFFGLKVAYKPESGIAFDLSECTAEAFDLAWQKAEYGIAAALVNQFGEDACLDKQALRARAKELLKQEGDGEGLKAKHAELVEERKTQIHTVADLARTTGKFIRLDYTPVFAARL